MECTAQPISLTLLLCHLPDEFRSPLNPQRYSVYVLYLCQLIDINCHYKGTVKNHLHWSKLLGFPTKKKANIKQCKAHRPVQTSLFFSLLWSSEIFSKIWSVVSGFALRRNHFVQWALVLLCGAANVPTVIVNWFFHCRHRCGSDEMNRDVTDSLVLSL